MNKYNINMKLGKVVSTTIVATSLSMSVSLADTLSVYGNTVYGSDGSTWSTYGNTTYGSGGNTFSTYGNTTYGSDGSTWSVYGNTAYGN